MSDSISINSLTFGYPGSIEPIFKNFSVRLFSGWTGIVGPNGSGKSTLCKIVCGLLSPDAGQIEKSGPAIYCEQRTDFMPEKFQYLINSYESFAFKIKIQLGIADEWIDRWESLSHGERKRCQIAAALYANSTILAVDEPSNHLDQPGKSALFRALQRFNGIGLLISHDRYFLDQLCRHTLFISPPGAELRKNPYSVALSSRRQEQNFQVERYERARKKVKKLTRQVHSQHVKVQSSRFQKSKRHIHRKDHDASAKTDLARLTGKDAVQGRALERLKTRLSGAQQEKEDIKISKTYDLGIHIRQADIQRFFPVTIPSFLLKMGQKRQLYVPNLTIQAGEKIGLAGENGSGKSSFVGDLIEKLDVPEKYLLYIPQEIHIKRAANVLKDIHDLQNDQKGLLLALVRRLGSDPGRLLESDIPSPGEVRKLLLALGLLQNPVLIIMDEPTNHMDLPSIENIEAALKDCGCAMLLVSHDLHFLSNICSIFWLFSSGNKNESVISERHFLPHI